MRAFSLRVLVTFFVVRSLVVSSAALSSDVYRLRLQCDPEQSVLRGSMDLRYLNNGREPLAEVRLRLDVNLGRTDPMQIDQVCDGDGSQLPWDYGPFGFGKLFSKKAQLSVTLPHPIQPGQHTDLQITFQLEDARFVNRSMLTLQDDPFHSLDAWYPKAMSRHGDDWSIDDDRPAEYDVTIELPTAAGAIASTGRAIESRETEQRATRIVRLRASEVRGFTIYASPVWETHRRTAHDVDLGVHIRADASKWAGPILDAAADVIAFFEQEYGPFPSDHLEIVCLGTLKDHPHGSSATCNGVTIWLNSEFGENYRIHVAHEIAHQYFGSHVGIHRNEIAWAPMGVGMMMDHAYMVHRNLDDADFRYTIRWFYFEAVRREYETSLAIPVDKAMKNGLRWNMPLMHGKAYKVCRMLEQLVGQKEFRNVIRRVLRNKQGELLSGTEFIEFCETTHGERLDWFVAEWIDGNATLDYAITDVKRDAEGWLVIVESRGQATFPAIVEAETENGELIRRRIDRTQAVNRLMFDTLDALRWVVVDPHRVCPDVDRTNNGWPENAASP